MFKANRFIRLIRIQREAQSNKSFRFNIGRDRGGNTFNGADGCNGVKIFYSWKIFQKKHF